MTMLLVSAAEMRALDRATIEGHGTPGHVLMERAGAGATRMLLRVFPRLRRGRHAIIFAGKGNNGGDGFVMARLLRKRGVRTSVVLLGRAADVTGDAQRNLRTYVRERGEMKEVTAATQLRQAAAALQKADVVVDAIFGTGLNSEVRGVQRAAIELINTAGVPVFAVDIPSGLDADTGQPLGICVQATATATFGFAKVGQILFPGALHVGRLEVIDIGLAPQAVAQHRPQAECMEPADLVPLLPVRQADAHKGNCGHLLVIAGGFGKTGAAQLVARAAQRIGSGLVTLVGPASLYPVYAAGVLETMTEVLPDRDGQILFDESRLRELSEGKAAVAIGPGIGTHDDALRIVEWLLKRADLPVVLDADALTCVGRDLPMLRRARAALLLTPHPGEMARLLGVTSGAVQSDRVGTARRFAAEHRCTLVLKGARTVVADPSSFVRINPTGNAGMAAGGMGDVLTGILGGLLAQGLSPTGAARLGTYLHGAAGDQAAAELGEIGLLASDLIERLPASMQRLQRHASATPEPKRGRARGPGRDA